MPVRRCRMECAKGLLAANTPADRQRRKNEALAKEVFGKGRRSSAPGAGAGMGSRKPNAVPSLASRIGVAKRTVSTSAKNTFKQQPRANPRPAGNVDAEWTHDLHSLNNSSASGPPRGPRASRPNRKDQLYSAINSSESSSASQFNIIGTSKPAGGMSIRGLAGPYLVVIKNLALGTTVADIESAITPVGGAVVRCQLIAERPKVIAEVEFENKEGADNVVDTLNNQNADGNILHVYHKVGGAPTGPKSSNPIAPLGRRAEAITDDSRSSYGSSERYTPRDRERSRRESDDIMDGSYGFDDRMDTDDHDDRRTRGSLYSDNLIGNRGRGRANSRDRGRSDGGRGNGGRGYR
ncbi:putative RNA-binding protein [Lachnellula cervina]|uniref:Putative RNA-binding protein n=1 Tax=Lachnellula cervina TaxID=1316786 RepID=A0A7D8YZL4_9HELO|nr:putative RNA-binding protein [Lachnellula cervina]